MEGVEDVHRQVHARHWRWCWPENVSLLLWVQDSPETQAAATTAVASSRG